MEAEAARTRIQLQTVLDSTPALIVALDEKGQITLINRFALNLLGYTEEELLGRNWFDTCLPQPEGRENVYPVFLRIMAGEIAPVEEFENTALCRNGRQLLIAWRNTSTTDEHGRIVGTLSSGMDITERKRAESQLSEREEFLRMITENVDDFIAVLDTQGMRLYNSPSYGRLFGDAGSLLHTNSFAEIHQDDRDLVKSAFMETVRSGISQCLDYRFVLPDGTVRNMESRGGVIRNSAGEVSSVVVVSRDVTERKQAERELRELNERLEERVEQRTRELTQAKQLAESANRVKSEFLANMSHEIRTPLNSILGMAHLALNLKTDRKNQSYLRNIQSSGEHLLGIIDDILDFSKLDAGKLKIETVDFCLDRVLESVNNLVVGKAAAKGLELSFDVDAGLRVSLRGDPLRLVQILVNYADNAVKFTETGGITLRARKIGEDKTSCHVRFEVQDTGIGIGGAEQAKLFQPFQQLDASSTRQYGGTGLGLAICRQLAGMMPDGAIGVDSVPGQGSTFWFSVRLDKSSQPCCAENDNGAGISPDILAAINGAHILLVENNLFNQQVATEFLEKAGATVCVAQNGKEALGLLDNDNFACVLMDIQMPVMDGFEATRLIRANPDLAGMCVIAMTASASERDRERCLDAGMNDFIGKPFRPHAFYATVARCLSGQAADFAMPAAAADRAAGSGDADVMDFLALAELVGGDKSKMREFAFKFLASARQDMAKVEAALERKDMAALGALGHHIKSPARMAGATGLADMCQKLEGYAKGGAGIGQIQELANQMRALLERVDEKISKEFA